MTNKAKLEAALRNPNVRKFLDLIAHTEGTENHGYATAFGGGKINSLKDHPRYLKKFKQKDGKTNYTSAAGRYQFVRKTWDGLANQYGFTDFGPHNQDLGAVALLEQRGALNDILKGDWRTGVKKVGAEWASMPTAPAAYSQPTRSWNSVTKFMGGDNTAPPVDPRLNMSASELIADLRKGGNKSDEQIFVDILNSNAPAGAELVARYDAGEDFSAIASSVGLKVPQRGIADSTAPPVDPRMNMSASELIDDLRKDGNKSDEQIFVDILNSNAPAGAELVARYDAGEDFHAIARSVGLEVPQRGIVDSTTAQDTAGMGSDTYDTYGPATDAEPLYANDELQPLMADWQGANEQSVLSAGNAVNNNVTPPQGLKPALTTLSEILPDRGDTESYVDYMGRALGGFANDTRLKSNSNGTILQTNNTLPTQGPIPLSQALLS